MSEIVQDTADLEARISKLEAARRGLTSVDLITKVVPACVAIAAVVIGIFQYQNTKNMEFRQRFWEERLKLYQEACSAASTIATAKTLADSQQQQSEFWQLYWGRLSLIEDREVMTAMVRFGNELREATDHSASKQALEQRSYELARACRNSLKRTWEPAPMDDIPESKGGGEDGS